MASRRRGISRRTFLRGAGTIAIALPWMPEIAFADPGQNGIPTRFITAFFGLGIDPSWQNDFTGPLEPYADFANHMAMFSVNMRQGDKGGAHCNTSTIVFVGERSQTVDIAGGPSLDQKIRRACDPTGPTLVSGLWWRRGACNAQAQRVYNADGSPRPPIKRPSEVFDNLFGSIPDMPDPSEDDLDARRQRRIRRSVLDTVVAEYQHMRGDRSVLGRESKLKLEQHLTSIREIEAQLAPADDVVDHMDSPDLCDASPQRPNDPDIADYDRFTYGTGNGAPEITWQDFQTVYRLHADLWAVALRCDRVRYGNLMFESAGGHTNFRGSYSALGNSTDFPGSSQHDSYFHDNQRQHAELYQHLAQTNIAYFLRQLNDPDHLEANGRTVLENATVLIGTEYGWNHSKENAFHAVVGGGGRFRSGFYTDRDINCIDLYNAILTGFDLPADIGQATNVDSEGDASILLA